MKTSLELDEELAEQVAQAASLVREKPATVLRMAIRAGLPVVTSRFQAPRPEGYFADAYPLPKDRLELEAAMASSTRVWERLPGNGSSKSRASSRKC